MAGFNLVELMATLVVIGVLLGVGLPAINRFVESNRLTSATNNLISDLSVARTEAVKRGLRVGVCTSTDASTCSASTWERGWLVFVDKDGNSAWTAGTDEVVRARESLPGSMAASSVLSTGGGINLSLYDRQGAVPALRATDTDDAIEYSFCNTKLGRGRKVTVNEFGRHTLANIDC
ncbi:general secretion pathway protein H [Sulfurifustis variabilis]|uniref:Type II secretion system protein H n=2 Tax=Sulfurifustis variabilis TaxID=1675686 RepID=A0A1B4V2Y3_9GAMM|nr:general secretion pathway protein H [Sulfurifustis variabilis]